MSGGHTYPGYKSGIPSKHIYQVFSWIPLIVTPLKHRFSPPLCRHHSFLSHPGLNPSQREFPLILTHPDRGWLTHHASMHHSILTDPPRQGMVDPP